jgi:hypothetical protein
MSSDQALNSAPPPNGDQQDDGKAAEGADTVEYWKSMARKNERLAKQRAAELEESKASLTSTANDIAAAKAAVESAKGEALRLRVALAAGLPPALAERLRGNTQEELEADAESLKGLVRTPVGTPDAKTGTGTANTKSAPDLNTLFRIAAGGA